MTVPVKHYTLIEARNALSEAVNAQRGGISARQDEIDLAFAALDIAITKFGAELATERTAREAAEKALHNAGALKVQWIEDYNRVKQSYQLKVDDFARETLRASDLQAQLTEVQSQLFAAGALLRKLTLDVAGTWTAFELELRGVIGHSNYAVIQRRIDEAGAALADDI